MWPRARGRAVLVAVGLGALLCAGVVLAPPAYQGPFGTLRAAFVETAAGIGASALTWGVVLLAGAVTVALLYRGRSGPTPPGFDFESGARQRRAMTTPDASPESAPESGDGTVAGVLESELRRATVGMEDPSTDGTAVRERLRAAATASVRRAPTGPDDRETAREAVERGAWTDDPVAAAFLAGAGGPAQPLGARLRGWLRPDTAFERRVERTVSAIHDRTAASGLLDPDRSPPTGGPGEVPAHE